MMNDNNNRDNSYPHYPQSQIPPQQIPPQSQTRWQVPPPQPPRPPKKGLSGGAIAAIVVASLCLSTLTGAVGATAGYALNQRATNQQIEELRAVINSLPSSSGNTASSASIVIPSESTVSSVAAMVENVRDSVVGIEVQVPVNNGFYGRTRTATSSGSGVIISQDGYILTNNHVVSGATEVTVMFENGESASGKIIGTDSKTDLAIIKVEKSGLKAASLGASGQMNVGDTVVAIGNPLGELNGTVTQGIISAKDRPVTFEDGRDMNLLQTDAAINGGNSGGALVNMNGEVIGIVVAKTSGVGVEGLGFAIPIDDAKPIIDELINNGYVTQRPQRLGVSLAEITTDQEMWMYEVDKPGLYIARVEEGSAAEEAGVQPGDLVISFDGNDVTSAQQLNEIRDSHKPGDVIPMVVEREGKNITINITIREDKPVQEKAM